MSKPVFTHSEDQFKQITQDMLRIARNSEQQMQCEVEENEGGGLSISAQGQSRNHRAKSR